MADSEHIIPLNVSPAQLEALTAAAGQSAESLPSFVLNAALRAATDTEGTPTEDREAVLAQRLAPPTGDTQRRHSDDLQDDQTYADLTDEDFESLLQTVTWKDSQYRAVKREQTRRIVRAMVARQLATGRTASDTPTES